MKNILQLLFSVYTLILFSSCEKPNVVPASVPAQPAENRQLYSQACQQYYYYYGGQQTSLGTAFTAQLNIGFKKGTDLAKKLKVLEAYPQLGSILYTQQTAGGEVTVVALQPGVTCSTVDSLLQVLPQDTHIDFAGAYFQYPNYPGAQLGLANSIIITLAGTTTPTQLSDLLAQTRSEIVTDLGYGSYIIKLTKQTPMNCLETANYLFETGLFEAAEPDFIMVMPPL